MSTQSDNLIINGHSFNPKRDIAYNKPRVNKANGKSVGILNKHTSRQLMLSTPLMLTWGINRRVDEQTNKESYDMALQFPQEGYTNEQTTHFLDSLQSLEKSVKEAAISNSKTWFNKTSLTDAHLEVMFHPMLQWPKNKETGEPDRSRAPTLKVKLDYWDSKFNCEIYDMDKKQLFPSDDEAVTPSELIGKASNVACIIKCGGVWIGNGKFGVTWKLVQAVVKPKASVRGKCFIELTTHDKKRMEEQSDEEVDGVDRNAVGVEVTNDSDDDEEETTPQEVAREEVREVAREEPQEVVVEKSAPVVAKKKVVRRKKD
jgi:hypothetical protein